MTTLTLRDLGFVGATPDRWRPSMITTALYLDAADASTVVVSNGTVSQWSDKSGNNRHATNETVSTQPTYVSGGIVFTGDRLNLPGLAFPITVDYCTISAVMQPTTTGSTGAGLVNINSSPNDDPEIRLGIDGYVRVYYNGGYAIETSNNAILSKSIVSVAMTPSVTSSYSLNGTLIQTGTRAGGLNSISTFTLGAYPRINGTRNGTIWKLVVYPSSASTQQKVEGWMAWEENLVSLLPSDHPYKFAPPTV